MLYEVITHSQNRTEQAEERRDRCDRTQAVQIAIQFRHYVPASVLDRLFDDLAIVASIDQPRRQYAAKRGALTQQLYARFVELLAL